MEFLKKLTVLLLVAQLPMGVFPTDWAPKVPGLYIFGDSLSDSGTNNYIPGPGVPRANFVPYGETFFHYPSGRFSDGRHGQDFIASFLGLPFPPPFYSGLNFFQGVNFASGGSGILNVTCNTCFDLNLGLGLRVVPLSYQIQQFEQVVADLALKLGSGAAHTLLAKSIFSFNTGGNDFATYFNNATFQSQYTPTQFITLLISEFQKDLVTVIGLGARKLLVFNIGTIGCVPSTLAATNSSTCNAGINAFISVYNVALKQLVTSINAQFNVTVTLADSFDVFFNLVNNGADYGFKNVTSACCGTGKFNAETQCGTVPIYNLCRNVSEYLFWDFVHPTDRATQIVASTFLNGNTSVIAPVNIAQLALL